MLRERAAEHPDRPLAVHGGVTLTYGEAKQRSDALAGAFSALGLGPDKPVMILSGNSLEHLVVSLAAYAACAPVMPISVAYSLMSSDHARIRAIAELTEPGLVFADDAGPFSGALDALASHAPRVLVARGERSGAIRLADLWETSAHGDSPLDGDPGPGADTVAKLLFTSGSTGVPKGVINTHRMLCCNQAMLRVPWPFLSEEPPILVDWLPWSHTFGGNHNLNLALFNGGTIHIDDGRPAPPLFPKTLAALNEVPPTLYFNVPAGYALLAPALESDPALAERFFSRLRFMFYAAAALPDALAERLRALAERYADHQVPLTSSWGTTETSPRGHDDALPRRADRMHRRPLSRRQRQARPGRRQARDPGQGTERHARLLPPARADRGHVRRGGLLPLGRRGHVDRRPGPEPGADVRRADRRELQAPDRHLGRGGIAEDAPPQYRRGPQRRRDRGAGRRVRGGPGLGQPGRRRRATRPRFASTCRKRSPN